MSGPWPFDSHLHWIGTEHYSIPEFIQEARKWGVSRRIKPGTLRAMAWGDRIYLASREKGLRAPVIFGYFSLEGIGGEGMGKRFDAIGQLGRALAAMPRDKGGERTMRKGEEILEDLKELEAGLAGEDRVKMRAWALFLEVFIDLRDELVRVESRLS